MNSYLGLSDLASSWQMRQQNFAIKNNLFQTGQKLATGEKNMSEIAAAGHVQRIFAFDHSLEINDRYKQATDAARVQLDTIQSVLGTVRDTAANVGLGVLSYLDSNDQASGMVAARGAFPALQSIVNMLNTNIGGRSIFSGAATDRAPLVDAAQIQADIDGIVAAAPDAATALSNIDFYFNNPAGGFATTAYLGSVNAAPDVRVDAFESIGFPIRADDIALRETLRNLAVIGSVANGAFPTSQADQRAMLLDAATLNLSTSDAVIRLRESSGYDQERLENAAVRNGAERSRLMVARVDIANVDPYETASQFQDLQGQLEKLYVVTSRLAQLSLTNFIS